MAKRLVLSGGLLAACWFGLAACGGSATDDNTGGTTIRVTPGDPCQKPGSTAPSVDGCNTCSCGEGGWVCTDVACTEPCDEGASRPAGDGCNTCTCSNGQWGCTLMGCADPPVNECPAPLETEPGIACNTVVVYARAPDTGLCCMYGSPCVAPLGWEAFYSQEECEGGGACVPGATRPDGDGCNTCSCTEQGWACTNMACTECVPGDTRLAEDGCNTCTCGPEGRWACTEKACLPRAACGARAGDTCAADEYCAYVEGQYCGAADAEATCQKRPQACTQEYAPVCGCDGQTYSNDCVAAGSGTGVLHGGECQN